MFGKKTTAEELLKLFSALSDEEKQKFLGAVNDKGDADSVTATESETEEEEQDNPSVEETEESTEEPITTPEAKTTDAPAEEGLAEATPVEDAPTEETPATDASAVPDTQATDNTTAILEGFGTRLTAIEEALKGFTELKELMEQYTQAQADKFGYNGTVPGGKKDYKEMSADELKKEILTGGN